MVLFPYGKSPDFTHRVLRCFKHDELLWFQMFIFYHGMVAKSSENQFVYGWLRLPGTRHGPWAGQYIGPHNQGAMCRDQRCIQKSYRDVLWKKHKLKLSKHLKISPYSHIFTMKIMNHHESHFRAIARNPLQRTLPTLPAGHSACPHHAGSKHSGAGGKVEHHFAGTVLVESSANPSGNPWWIYGWDMLSGEESWLLTW